MSAATRLPAIWLGIDKLVGTAEAGKYADLVMLDANPLDDIENTRKIFGVFVKGRWLERLNGRVGLWVGNNSEGWLRNLTISRPHPPGGCP